MIEKVIINSIQLVKKFKYLIPDFFISYFISSNLKTIDKIKIYIISSNVIVLFNV